METSSDKDKNNFFREIVIFQDEVSRISHKALFSLDDVCYKQSHINIIDSVMEVAQTGLSKLHISAGWENILKVAVWTCDNPSIHDVISLVKKCGVKEEDLMPFRHSDINDLYPWLYYSNRTDIMRKICSAAKTRVESRIDSRKVLVYCHLVSEETQKIIASSL